MAFSTFFDQLSELYDFWFLTDTSKYWFDSTPEFDNLIKEKYKNLLDSSILSILQIEQQKYLEDNYKLSIALILLYDQVPRHIYRNETSKINYYLDLIVLFSKKVYIKYRYDLKENDFCFVLLPLRHTNIFENILYVIQETKIKIKQNQKVLQYKKFLKATLERYIKFNTDKENISLVNSISKEDIYQIVDPEQICELELITYNPIPLKNIIYDELPDYIKKTISEIKSHIRVEPGIISLSGGVDSMVLSYILKYLDLNIIAIHINYNNRNECSNEVDIITQWAKFLNIKLYVRKITEINRPEMMEYNMRDLYESYTRDIRFNTYINSDVINNNVFVGHNHDDQFENIFTNIISESHYDNLRGMKYETNIPFKQTNIKFLRPMLDIPKNIIYKIARYFNIPHFKDSTPKWSQRGKIRDSVRPSIEQWDDRAITSFFKLSDTVSDLLKISDYMAKTIASQINETKIWIIDLNDILPKTLYELIFKHLDIIMTQKSINVFYEKLEFIKKNKDKYKINSIEKITLNKNHIIKWINLDGMYIKLFFS
jgi:tRNA(Ile)-lysidine synthetase-like protein